MWGLHLYPSDAGILFSELLSEPNSTFYFALFLAKNGVIQVDQLTVFTSLFSKKFLGICKTIKSTFKEPYFCEEGVSSGEGLMLAFGSVRRMAGLPELFPSLLV